MDCEHLWDDPFVNVDRFGDFGFVTAFSMGRKDDCERLLEKLQAEHMISGYFGVVREKGQLPKNLAHWVDLSKFGPVPPESFVATEDEDRYEIHFKEDFHPGLFLDHRPLRRWLRSKCRGSRVLNGFCYTGSLSIAAVRGGSSEVTQVDLSKKTLVWAQKNILLNGFETDQIRSIPEDVMTVLPRWARQGKQFDLVMMDPPSFARTGSKRGNKVFRIETHLEELLDLCYGVTALKGRIVLSINTETMTQEVFRRRIEQWMGRDRSLSVESEIDGQWGTHIKGVIIKRQ